MKMKNYSRPRVEVRVSRLRTGLLAGSQVVKGKDFEGFEVRERFETVTD